MNCVSENSLRAYQDGELSGVEGIEIEAHLASCATVLESAWVKLPQLPRVWRSKWFLWALLRQKQS